MWRGALQVERKKILARIFAGAAVLAVAGAVSAALGDEIFTVGNYPVDAQAKNAVTAKKRSFGGGPASRIPLIVEAGRPRHCIRSPEASIIAQFIEFF